MTEINPQRFREKPHTDIDLTWWNKHVSWTSYGELTGHQVAVAQTSKRRWDIHGWILAGVAAVVLLGLVLFAHVPFIYAFIFLAALALALVLVLRFEQNLLGDTTHVDRVVVLDAPVWAMIVMRARRMMDDTAAKQKKRFKDDLDKHLKEHKKAVKAAKRAGETPPEYVKLDEDAYINPATQKNATDIYTDIVHQLSDSVLEASNERIEDYWREHDYQRQSLGYGVQGCSCMACKVNEEEGTIPEMSGVVAASRRRSEAHTDDSQASFMRRISSMAGLNMTDKQRQLRKSEKRYRQQYEREQKRAEREAQLAERKRRTEMDRQAEERLKQWSAK